MKRENVVLYGLMSLTCSTISGFRFLHIHYYNLLDANIKNTKIALAYIKY